MSHPASPLMQSARPVRSMRSMRRSAVSRHAGLSLVELILALAITSMLLTATMVALDASFKAYAAAAEEASTQTQTRMITQRLLTLIRTSTVHGPTDADYSTTPSTFITLVDVNGDKLTVGYSSVNKELWLTQGWEADGAALTKQPLLSGVSQASFYIGRRRDNTGVWVLERATVDITVLPSPDASLAIEKGAGQAIRLIASTMPRKLD